MSNRRRGRVRNTYRTGYLRSPAWFRRRDHWFSRAERRGPVACAACGSPGTRRTLELHHLTYRGVRTLDGRWLATEHDDELIPLHPGCHELLHRLLDRDLVLARSRTRSTASHLALQRLRAALPPGRQP
ncbi:MAG: hypothetical protein K0Q52_73 [Microbacterium sp.]|nr:hypothetical protein [Microbacterium sp.]